MLSALRSAVERVASVPAAAAGGWQEAAGAVRARVPAPRQAEFDALLAQTRGVMHLRDERAIYTDLWAAGILHRAMLACASRVEKLRAAGKEHLALDATLEELLAALANGLGQEVQDRWAARREHRVSASIRDAPELIGGVDVEITPEHFPNKWLARSFATIMMATRSIATPHDFEDQYAGLAGGAKASDNKKTLFGLAGAKGVAEGPARVVRSAEDCARVAKGDIIVTESPSSLINLILPFAAGIVCDFGATLSHAAVCAREANIPCVIGVRVGTVLIKDGARIRVDGGAGTVHVLE